MGHWICCCWKIPRHALAYVHANSSMVAHRKLRSKLSNGSDIKLLKVCQGMDLPIHWHPIHWQHCNWQQQTSKLTHLAHNALRCSWHTHLLCTNSNNTRTRKHVHLDLHTVLALYSKTQVTDTFSCHAPGQVCQVAVLHAVGVETPYLFAWMWKLRIYLHGSLRCTALIGCTVPCWEVGACQTRFAPPPIALYMAAAVNLGYLPLSKPLCSTAGSDTALLSHAACLSCCRRLPTV